MIEKEKIVSRAVLARHFACFPVLIEGLKEIQGGDSEDAISLARDTLERWDELRSYREPGTSS